MLHLNMGADILDAFVAFAFLAKGSGIKAPRNAFEAHQALALFVALLTVIATCDVVISFGEAIVDVIQP